VMEGPMWEVELALLAMLDWNCVGRSGEGSVLRYLDR
jgi:hypothetical protein